MNRFIFLLIILCSLVFADNLNIKERYFMDINNSFSIKNILNKKNEFEEVKKYNLGVFKGTIWIHINLKNNSDYPVMKRISTRLSGIDLIDVFILNNDKIVKTYQLGDFRDHKDRDNHFRTSYFDIDFKPNQEINVFIKQRNHGNMDIRWNIEDINNFNIYYSNQGMIYTFIFGILSVATIVSFVLFFLLKNKFYLIYAFFTLGSITYQATLAGFMYQFYIPVYLNTLFGFSVPILTLILLGMFPFYFFTLKKNEFKTIKFIIKLLIITLIPFFVAELFYPFFTDILYFTKYVNIIGILLLLTLCILSIKLFLLDKDGSFFYLLAISIMLIAITYYILTHSGTIGYNDFDYYVIAIGTISQDIFLGLALIHATYQIKKDNEKNTTLLNEYSKLSFIGQTMINISHQWKTPINSIYNSINHIEIAREFKDKNLDTIIDKNLKNIKETTIYLRDTALSQLNFYKEPTNIEEISVYNEIKYVIKLIKGEFSKKSIDIEFDCPKEIKIKIEKNYFLNILMILLENSFKVFENKDIIKPHILIKVEKKEERLNIIFEDNAGGISDENIDKIFDKNYTLNKSTGIGLYLAKEIITYKLKGEIEVQNIDKGIQFKILL